MFKLALLTTAAVVIGCFVFLLLHLGVFREVQLEVGQAPDLRLLYKEHVGPYHKINEKIQTVEAWAKINQIPCLLTFGEYFDDPSIVEEPRLRSRGGCLVETAPAEKPADFFYAEYPQRPAIKATFSGSPSIGPYKVYNKVESLRLEQRLAPAGAAIEIYEVLSEKEMNTTYYFPIKN